MPSASPECHQLDTAIPPEGINTGVQTMAHNNLKEICPVQICTVFRIAEKVYSNVNAGGSRLRGNTF